MLPEALGRGPLQVHREQLSEHNSALENQRRDERVLHGDRDDGKRKDAKDARGTARRQVCLRRWGFGLLS